MNCLAFNRVDVAQMLLNAGANLNIRNFDGKTALTLAVEDKKNAIARLLREAGAIE
jgi:ankyrin repeat protein